MRTKEKTGLNDVGKREQTIFYVYNYNANISNMENGCHNNTNLRGFQNTA